MSVLQSLFLIFLSRITDILFIKKYWTLGSQYFCISNATLRIQFHRLAQHKYKKLRKVRVPVCTVQRSQVLQITQVKYQHQGHRRSVKDSKSQAQLKRLLSMGFAFGTWSCFFFVLVCVMLLS